MNTKLPQKIFNRCKAIPFGTDVHVTSKNNKYKFCGIRDKRITNETLLYSIPNNKNIEQPYIKGFQRIELDGLWNILLTNKCLSIKDLETKFPMLIKEGKCCFSVFFGLICYLFPKRFIKKGSVIKIN